MTLRASDVEGSFHEVAISGSLEWANKLEKKQAKESHFCRVRVIAGLFK